MLMGIPYSWKGLIPSSNRIRSQRLAGTCFYFGDQARSRIEFGHVWDDDDLGSRIPNCNFMFSPPEILIPEDLMSLERFHYDSKVFWVVLDVREFDVLESIHQHEALMLTQDGSVQTFTLLHVSVAVHSNHENVALTPTLLQIPKMEVVH